MHVTLEIIGSYYHVEFHHISVSHVLLSFWYRNFHFVASVNRAGMAQSV